MITVLHGDDIEHSRLELQRLIAAKKSTDIRHIGRGTDATNLIQAFDSHSLFGAKTLVVIENLFGSILKKTKSVDVFVRVLRHAPKDAEIIVWEQKELPGTLLTKLGTGVIAKLFKTPVLIFGFLDAIKPGQTKTCLERYAKLSDLQASEIIFLMLTRRMRQLIMIFSGTSPVGLQQWQIERLTVQARVFRLDTLQAMYKNLLNIDYSIKSGQSAFSLGEHIEQFLIQYL